MLLSIALILLVGMSMGWICKKIKLPSLLGMMITGMILGPYVLNLLDDSIGFLLEYNNFFTDNSNGFVNVLAVLHHARTELLGIVPEKKGGER